MAIYQGPSILPQGTPRSLSEEIKELPRQYLEVLTKPGVATLAAQMGKANWRVVWVQLLGWGFISTILGFVAQVIFISMSYPFTGSRLVALHERVGRSPLAAHCHFGSGRGARGNLAHAAGHLPRTARELYGNTDMPIPLIPVPLVFIMLLMGLLIPQLGLLAGEPHRQAAVTRFASVGKRYPARLERWLVPVSTLLISATLGQAASPTS